MIKIRSEVKGDYEAITVVNDKAFKGTQESQIVKKLRVTKSFDPELSLVADNDNQIIGHILLTETTLEISSQEKRSLLLLAPMAILPEYQKNGIGKQLILKAIEKAKKTDYPAIILLGHPEYYSRFGFKPSSLWNIKMDIDAPEEAIMILELKEKALQNIQGIVHLNPAFFES